jgi:hypothetical protein
MEVSRHTMMNTGGTSFLAVAAIESDPAAFDLRNRAKAVVFVFETHSSSSKGLSVSVASMGWRRFGEVDVRPMLKHPF